MITTLAMLITLFCGIAAGAWVGHALARPFVEEHQRRVIDRYKKARDEAEAEWNRDD